MIKKARKKENSLLFAIQSLPNEYKIMINRVIGETELNK
jgi:hypothetical protein